LTGALGSVEAMGLEHVRVDADGRFRCPVCRSTSLRRQTKLKDITTLHWREPGSGLTCRDCGARLEIESEPTPSVR